MYDGDKAVLTMVQYLKEDKEKDENIYEATVIEYQKEMEQVHLILRSGSLSDISLDAVYECRIRTITCETVCTGMIKERSLSYILQLLRRPSYVSHKAW